MTRAADPTETAKELAEAPSAEVGPMTAAASVSIALGPNTNGWFTLYWAAAAPSSYDWIGLYPSDATPDTGFITGNNWQWAVKGDTDPVSKEKNYVSSTAVQKSGYQARYLSWDPTAKVYRSILRTPAFVGEVCA